MSDNIVFEHEIDGKPVKFKVKIPSGPQLEEAQKTRNIYFRKALESGAILKAKMEDYLREQNLWDDKKEAELNQLNLEIGQAELALKKGGIRLKEAREIAINLKTLREKRTEILLVRRHLENNTAEGQADNMQFNHLVSMCLVYNDTEKPYYSSLTDYLLKQTETLAFEGGGKLASLLYGLDNDYEKKLPENKFLIDYKFVDKDLRYINSDGHLIDEKGRLVNEKGQLVDKEGNLVDEHGNKIDDNGDPVVKFSPFLDDNGKPVIQTTTTVPVENTTTLEPMQEAA